MKKALLFLLVPLVVFNNAVGELCKLPALFAHYSEHRQQDDSIDLLDFLFMHYVGDDNTPSDEDRDQQLPFKKVCGQPAFELAFLPAVKPVVEELPEFAEDTRIPVLPGTGLPDPGMNTPFRPPCGA